MSGVIFLESATGTQWVEFKDAAKQPVMHRKPPTTKTYSAKIDNSVEIEKTLLQGEHLTSLASLSQMAIVFLTWIAFQGSSY